jgi:hypothetical protein
MAEFDRVQVLDALEKRLSVEQAKYTDASKRYPREFKDYKDRVLTKLSVVTAQVKLADDVNALGNVVNRITRYSIEQDLDAPKTPDKRTVEDIEKHIRRLKLMTTKGVSAKERGDFLQYL